ncbi:hypothetical protein PsYK624_055440 [Phanerochaete sordida]|uniref:Uncharacterized protein n=1 Tax=Phanerochaete sordida TaxID=48140 RepID=A0A9P3LCP1_9APHY|nr:hypothetical protein PsYK624_055440 [Phanerochaete sordida]
MKAPSYSPHGNRFLSEMWCRLTVLDGFPSRVLLTLMHHGADPAFSPEIDTLPLQWQMTLSNLTPSGVRENHCR